MDKKRLAEEIQLTDEHLILALQEIIRRVDELEEKIEQLCLGE